jgi:UDP-3-O-[3-hydroxymyristoyl] glucosamine N-acyltransferase
MGYQINGSMMLSELSDVLKLEHYGLDVLIEGIGPFNSAMVGDLTFSKTIEAPLKGVSVITSVKKSDLDSLDCGYLLSLNPRFDFIRALSFLKTTKGFSTWAKNSIIHPTVILGQNVVVEDGCSVGENSVIEHNVVLHSGTRIGKNCRIRSCASVGGDGFGFERLNGGVAIRFPHLGGVLIGDNVEIGSCAAVARGTLSDTIIEDNVKIDNLVHIAHNCFIKQGAFIIACAEISGGVVVGENAWIAPNSCTHQKISIGEGALVGLGAVVTKDVPDFSVFAGNPAKKIRDLS